MKTTLLEKTSLEWGGGRQWVFEKLLVTLALFWVLSWAPSEWFTGRKAVMDSRPPVELIMKEIERIEVQPVDSAGPGGFGPTLDEIYYSRWDVSKC